jgi:prevent-host-death family protein
MDIPAAQFKVECLKLMDQVDKTRETIIITKHGRPVAQLAPVPASPGSLFGYMKNTVRIGGDVVAPLEVEWSALSGDESHLYKRASAERPSARRSRKK